MRIEELYKYYITTKEAAAAINVSRETFHKWVRKGKIPMIQQCYYEKLTQGVLKASEHEQLDLSRICYPTFRFYSNDHGMCNVAALSFMKSKIVRIKVEIPGSNHPLISFETGRLMQSAYIKDSKGILLFEKDFVLVNRKKKLLQDVFNDELLIQELKTNKFVIVGNVFEGGVK